VAVCTHVRRPAPLPFPAGRALCRVAHSEGDQNEADHVSDDHEGGDGQGEPTEHAYHGPHPNPRCLPAAEPDTNRLQLGAVALDGTI
jgi:hypothetical protein